MVKAPPRAQVDRKIGQLRQPMRTGDGRQGRRNARSDRRRGESPLHHAESRIVPTKGGLHILACAAPAANRGRARGLDIGPAARRVPLALSFAGLSGECKLDRPRACPAAAPGRRGFARVTWRPRGVFPAIRGPFFPSQIRRNPFIAPRPASPATDERRSQSGKRRSKEFS
jgi:hypothetical protein